MELRSFIEYIQELRYDLKVIAERVRG